MQFARLIYSASERPTLQLIQQTRYRVVFVCLTRGYKTLL
jgi:hypothetical protein